MKKMTKIFIAHSLGYGQRAVEYTKHKESQGHQVYLPIRDTPQGNLKTVLNSNLKGIKWCDEVHIIWDGTSNGTLFDLGSAFALGKPLFVVDIKGRTWYSVMREFYNAYIDLDKSGY